MNCTIKINMDNAAFEDDPNELARILRDLAERIVADGAYEDSPIWDRYGNKVGELSITADAESD